MTPRFRYSDLSKTPNPDTVRVFHQPCGSDMCVLLMRTNCSILVAYRATNGTKQSPITLWSLFFVNRRCVYFFYSKCATGQKHAVCSGLISCMLTRTFAVRHGPQDKHVQVALRWAEGTYSWWSVLLSVFQMRSLPSWAHTAKYCRDLGEKTQGSCSEEMPSSAAISVALLASAACVLVTRAALWGHAH